MDLLLYLILIKIIYIITIDNSIIIQYNSTMTTLKEKLRELSTPDKESLLSTYYNILIEWNEKFNLTAITEKEEVLIKHFADSIAAVDIIKGKVLDIGAGAGFPSLPLKIFNPDIELVMIDSLNKRITFLNEIIKKLELKNAEAIHSRAEDYKEKGKFDFVVARAVAHLPTLLEYMMPFVKVGGKAVCYKSDGIDKEIDEAKKAVKVLGGESVEIQTFMLDENTPRKLVIIKKVRETPKNYPRSGNKPRTSPII